MDLVALLAPKGIRGCLRVRLRGVKVASTSRAAEGVQRAWKHGCVSSSAVFTRLGLNYA